jgi:hypothetical protein
MRYIRDISNTASDIFFIFLKIADSNDGRIVEDGTDKRSYPFMFDIFAKNDDGLINDGQPLAKRWRRAFFALPVYIE